MFLELPAEGGFGKNTENIRQWYADGSTQQDLLQKAARAARLRVESRLLGEGFHGRRLFRIDNLSDRDRAARWPCAELRDAFQCHGPDLCAA